MEIGKRKHKQRKLTTGVGNAAPKPRSCAVHALPARQEAIREAIAVPTLPCLFLPTQTRQTSHRERQDRFTEAGAKTSAITHLHAREA